MKKITLFLPKHRPVPLHANYSGDKKIFEYTLVTYSMCSNEDNVIFIVVLQRNILSFLMTDFTPTVLSNLIAYATNFFPQENFDAAIGVNLTILLVITTMYVIIT